jgi:N-acetylmuramoyl-L-alanine amidase
LGFKNNLMISMFKVKNLCRSIGFAMVLISGFAAAAKPKDAIVTDIRITSADHKAHFEVDLSKAVGFNVDVLPNPYRVIIDIAGVNFDLPPGIGRKGQGLVSSFRYGIVDSGRSRIVIDTTGPVLIESSSAKAAKGKTPAHLIVNLLETTPDAFAEAFAKDHPEVAATKVAAMVEPEAVAAITPAPSPHAPQNTGDARKIIVIDPGHGGIDPGAISPKKTLEKNVVLNYGKALRQELEKSGHYKVIMTRGDDTFVPLEKRVNIARENKADLFIAIHADTVQGQQARGTTLYTVSDKASDAEAEELAAKENRADIIAGIDLATESKEVANILINLAQRESRNRAIYFSKKAVTELKDVTALTGKPIRSAAFVVLKAPDVPSVLVELGYLSSKKDEALLISPAWNLRMARSMAKAIDNFFAPTVALNQK